VVKTANTATKVLLQTRQDRRVNLFKYEQVFLDCYWYTLASSSLAQPLDLWVTGKYDCPERPWLGQ
jgi:hypothetical protein